MSGGLAKVARRPWFWPAAAVLVGLLSVAYFYNRFWITGFALYQGGIADGRLTALIAAHWADPTRFQGGLTDLGFFYPAGGGLGYSDSMLAFGLLTAPLMWLGVGMLPAFQWTLVVFTLVGYASTVAFLRVGPRSTWFLSIAGGVLVNVSNGLFYGSGHPQLVAFSLCPVVLLGALRTARAKSRWGRVAWGVATGLILGLITYSAFYVGWFFVLGLGLTAAIAALLLILRSDLRPPWSQVAVGVGSGIVGFALMVPLFLVTYLPVLGQPRILENVLSSALRLRELTNVSTANLVWGHVLVAPHGDEMRIGEWAMAPTPLLLVLAITAAVAAGFAWRRLNGWSLIGLSTVAAGVVVWLLPVEVHGFAPWRVVFLLPGAAAIRAIGRIEILAGMMLALGLLILLTQWWSSARASRTARVVVVILLVLVAFEQTNLRSSQGVPLEKLVAIDSIAPPPVACQSFVLVPPFAPEQARFEHLLDAMFVAQSSRVPTWNGYSGDFPEGWNLWPDRPDYLDQVRLWRDRHHITNACGLRLVDGTWLLPDMLDSMLAEGTGR